MADPARPALAEVLAALPGRRGAWVFPGAHGQRRRDDDARWSPDTRLIRRTDGTSYRAEINGYRLRAGITRRVRFHDLRHTCASHLLMGTWGVRLPIEEVAAWLGHSSTAVTQRYAHPRQRRHRRIARGVHRAKTLRNKACARKATALGENRHGGLARRIYRVHIWCVGSAMDRGADGRTQRP